MRIEFQTISEQALPCFKGGEGVFFARIVDNADVKMLEGRLSPGSSIGLHRHDSDGGEIIRIEQGCGCVLYGGERLPLRAGDTHYCPRGESHSLINDSEHDLSFFAVIPKK